MTDKENKLRELVFAALDHAVDNGFETQMMNDTLENVGIELLDYDAAIYEAAAEDEIDEPAVMDVTPHVEAWRAGRKA